MRLSETQQSLIRHFQQLPETLPTDLAEASRGGVGVFGGDLLLERIATKDLFFRDIRVSDFDGKEVILLQSASGLNFAYDPDTGKEIANTMGRHMVTDRAEVSRRMVSHLRTDAVYQETRKGRTDLYNFVNKCADVLEHRA